MKALFVEEIIGACLVDVVEAWPKHGGVDLQCFVFGQYPRIKNEKKYWQTFILRRECHAYCAVDITFMFLPAMVMFGSRSTHMIM